MDVKNLPWYAQLGVFMLIGAVLFGVFYYLYMSPTKDEIDGKIRENETLEQDIRKAQNYQRILKKLSDENEKNEAIFETLRRILPKRMEIASILKKIQGIATNARLKIEGFDKTDDITRDIYIECPINLRISGNYHNLAIFFDQVSRIKKIYVISNLSITPKQNPTADFDIDAAFIASTFIEREGVKVAVPAAAPKPARAPRPAAEKEEGLGGI